MITVEVAAAVIFDRAGRRVLLSRRHSDAHQGGKWEFPGGKRGPGESFSQALVRELEEELGITPVEYRPLLRLAYQYPDKHVVLSVWRVDRFDGRPRGREGQPLRWRAVDALSAVDFPAANRAILQALRLPRRCLVTPDAGAFAEPVFLDHIEAALEGGIRLLQLRSHSLARAHYLALAGRVAGLCRRHGARLLLNMPAPWWFDDGLADGLHLSQAHLQALERRPALSGWLSASCHTVGELERAQSLGVDCVFVSPVRVTASHPGRAALGWSGLERLLRHSQVPVYALGGMEAVDLAPAASLGAFGIAAMSGLWSPVQ